VDLAEEGFDVAIRLSEELNPGFTARKLAPVSRIVCASPDFLRKKGHPKRIGDLARHECLSYSYPESQMTWQFRGPDGKERVKVRSRYQVNSVEAVRMAALEGHGVALLPTYIAGEDLRAGRLKTILKDYAPLTPFGDAVHAVYLSNQFLPQKVRVLIDFLAESFGSPPYWDHF
jgi:DNA-binding transcriptional LysR family regulator